jgi:two-component system, chemotaxis family, chemotaxis protein CheY
MAKILVVDDVKAIRKIVAAVLEPGRHVVSEACSGEEALSLVGSNAFHLVITDVNMPGISGLELISCLRSIGSYQRTPIMILANGNADKNVDEAMKLGANGWIEKPFRPETLLGIVNQVLVDSYVNS